MEVASDRECAADGGLGIALGPVRLPSGWSCVRASDVTGTLTASYSVALLLAVLLPVRPFIRSL